MADKKVSVLIVEDNKDLLYMFQMFFSDHLDVIEPVYVSSLEEARVKFAAGSYDLVVTDGQYPDSPKSPVINREAGIIFLSELKASSFAGQVIYLSSSDQHFEAIKTAGYAEAYSKGTFGSLDVVKRCLAMVKGAPATEASEQS